jgi:hypothetical protein
MKIGKVHKIVFFTSIATVVGVLLFYRAKASAAAKKWVNVGENGVNASFTNSVFQEMMKKVGWKSGEAWCMYLAKAVHMDAFKKESANINSILTGSTQTSWNNAKNDTTGTYKVVTSGNPQKGDIAIWQNTSNPSTGHAGIVIGRSGETFKTVEGNTNLAGSREGDKVLIKERPLAYGEKISGSNLKLLGFIRKKVNI